MSATILRAADRLDDLAARMTPGPWLVEENADGDMCLWHGDETRPLPLLVDYCSRRSRRGCEPPPPARRAAVVAALRAWARELVTVTNGRSVEARGGPHQSPSSPGMTVLPLDAWLRGAS